MTRRLLLALALTIITGACGGVAAADNRADLVVVNARIWTGDEAQPEATHLAVRDGRFIAVGDARAVTGLQAHRTIDAQGRRVIPGLIDTHVHLANAADAMGRLELRGAASRDELLERVRRHAEGMGADEWVLGRGWSAESWPDQRPPNADEIEDAAGGRRTVLVRMDGHSLLASRSALEEAGIDSAGPEDMPGGRIGRHEDGDPDGVLYGRAMGLVSDLVPPDDEHSIRTLLLRAVREANRHGVTQVSAIDTRQTVERYLAPLDIEGKLTLRCRVTVTSGATSLDEWRPLLEWAAHNRRLSEHIAVIGFKGQMDGSLGSRTAWMTQPYRDNPGDQENAGMPQAMTISGEMRELIFAGAALGLQPAIHAIGDRANNTLLNWYGELPETRRRVLRPRIEHAQHLLASDVERFGALGVIPSMQPLHKADDGRYAEQRLGRERLRSSYAFRSLLDSGASLAFGSDWPVVDINPFRGIDAAVNARTLEGRRFLPEQAITVEEALQSYTSLAARCLHSEDSTGVIRVGFGADFVVLDRDILTIDRSDIINTRPMMTVVAGTIAHEAE